MGADRKRRVARATQGEAVDDVVTETASPRQRRRYKGLSPRVIVGGLAGAITLGIPALLMTNYGGANAAVATIPQFPNNLVVFPNRDFVSIEGYSGYGGQPALLEVSRGGQVVGSATGTVSGTDVAFEVNHPGGYCWGAGGGLNVTPDILPGDVVSIKIPAVGTLPEVFDATTVLDVHASDGVQVDGTHMYVDMHIGANVDPANVEQRIIEPALRDTLVGKRDVRAAVGDPAPSNNGSYLSGISLHAGAGDLNYRADYDFTATPDATAIAANPGLGERAMAWEFTDPDANRQGLTIAEFGEPGGPGLGGCPNGPQQSGPPAPTSAVGAIVGGDIQVHWTKVTAIPGTPDILGYRVRAYEQSAGANNVIDEVSQKILDPNVTTATLHGFNPTEYNVEITSLSSVGETFPPAQVPVPPTDTTPPVVAASPNGGTFPVPQQVTLSTELGAEIWYTLDEPIQIDAGDVVNGTLYTGALPIDQTSTLRAVAIDPVGNISDVLVADFTITNDPLPGAPTITGSAVNVGSATIVWTAPTDPGSSTAVITGYRVEVFTSATGSTTVGLPIDIAGAATLTTTVNGLTPDTPYWFTVRAKNDVNTAYGPASVRFGPVTPLGDVVANAGPDQPAVVRGTTVTLSGQGSTTTGVTYQWEQLIAGLPVANGTNGVTILTPTARNASFVLPFHTFGRPRGPLTFRLSVSDGTKTITDEVTITPANDTIAVTTARWKLRDFRVTGTGSRPGALITIRTTAGTVLGNATVDALGAWTFRDRTSAAAPPGNQVLVESNFGGSITATVTPG